MLSANANPVARASDCVLRLYTLRGTLSPDQPKLPAATNESQPAAVASEKLPILPECEEYPEGSRRVSTANFLYTSVIAPTDVGRTMPSDFEGKEGNKLGHSSQWNFVENEVLHCG